MGIAPRDAVGMLLAGMLGLDIAENHDHRSLYTNHLLNSLSHEDPSVFNDNPYLKEIHWDCMRHGSISSRMLHYEPYELFPCGDLSINADGILRAPIGFFQTRWEYPALIENDQIWMSITPNEIITMERSLRQLHGTILVLGLGMGYFTFMATRIPGVEHITVVELNLDTIEFFTRNILPQIPYRDKLTILHGDAIDYLQKGGKYDCIYADIWHDVGDGLPLYKRIRSLESLWPDTHFDYWIRPSMDLYLQED